MQEIFQTLVDWYRNNARDLPWRNTKNPYHIWISEIMLQQTKVNSAVDYFLRFLEKFPDIPTLARSDEMEVLKYWQGLGYYSRALNIHSVSKILLANNAGEFPDNYNDIRNLKGIGDYTAAAVSSIAYGLPHAAVDGNVKRVAARFYGISESVFSPEVVQTITEELNRIIVQFNPAEFNQAVIELGALVCTPKSPKCPLCPLRPQCIAFDKNLQTVLPNRPARVKPRNRFLHFMLIEYKGETWIQRRDHSGIWKGLYEFPSCDTETNVETFDNLPETFQQLIDNSQNATVTDQCEMVHKLTHQTIFARFWHLSGKPSIIVRQNDSYIKVPLIGVQQYPVHRLMHRFLELKGLTATNKQTTDDKQSNSSGQAGKGPAD